MYFQTDIQIRFSDCDMLNHVNNAVFLQYFEMARVNFLNAELKGWNWDKNGIILAKNIVDYIRPLFLHDRCIVRVYCTKIGTTSFTLSYQLLTVENDIETIKSTGESVLVCFNFQSHKTEPIPQNLLSVLNKYNTSL